MIDPIEYTECRRSHWTLNATCQTSSCGGTRYSVEITNEIQPLYRRIEDAFTEIRNTSRYGRSGEMEKRKSDKRIRDGTATRTLVGSTRDAVRKSVVVIQNLNRLPRDKNFSF